MDKQRNSSGLFPILVIVSSMIVAFLIFEFILGAKSNFVDVERHTPKTGSIMGIMYKGGYLVPIILTMLLMVLIFSVERIMTLAKAKGTGNVANFVRKVQFHLATNNIAAAEAECDKQKGSVANVIKSGL